MSKSVYVCNKCQYESTRWLGKCPDCDTWSSMEEREVLSKKEQKNTKHDISLQEIINPKSIEETLVEMKGLKQVENYKFSADVLNKLFGNGVSSSGLYLVAGEPGLGKSTIALQLLKSLYNGQKNIDLLYITAEESIYELAKRAKRLSIPKEIKIFQSNNYENIEKIITSAKPNLVVVDSVQTIFSTKVDSAPGSVSQVSSLASRLMALSKSKNVAILVVGHVTKDGQIAGPKTLEHLVDAVCMLERSKNDNYRTLSFSKNRFGSTDEMLLLKMEEGGLTIVSDPSLALLENLETGVGVVYGMAMDKNMSLVVEVQALVSNNNFGEGGGYGSREALGFAKGKLNTIIAILEKYMNLDLKPLDIYVQITGLSKNNYDESLDLTIMMAILSSLQNKGAGVLVKTKKQKLVFAGRITLSGQIRTATKVEERKKTAKKLGFEYNFGISEGLIQSLLKKKV